MTLVRALTILLMATSLLVAVTLDVWSMRQPSPIARVYWRQMTVVETAVVTRVVEVTSTPEPPTPRPTPTERPAYVPPTPTPIRDASGKMVLR